MGLLAVVVFSNAIDRASDMVFRPWALADPPLLDHWVGTLTAGNGVRMALALDLRRAFDRNGDYPCARCAQIEGTATTCDERGTVLRYHISGSPKDRHARSMLLGATPEKEPAPDGLEFSTVSGGWDGADRLDIEADFVWRRGRSTISSTDDPATQPVPAPLERRGAGAFEAICAQVRRASTQA